MAQPQWVTPAGTLGTIPEGVFYSTPLLAVDPLGADTVYYSLIAGRLPEGMQIQQTGLLAGVPLAVSNIQGTPVEVSRDVTSKFAVRAYTQQVIGGVTVINRLVDRTFELTVTGQDAPEFVLPAGQIAQVFDGSQIIGIQVPYTDTDPDQIVTVRLVSGQLPPGLTISLRGVISGFIPITPTQNGTGFYSAPGEDWDEYPYNFSTRAESRNYQFTLEVSDGVNSNLRTYSIFVWSRSTMTADNTQLTADNIYVTADASTARPPLILNVPGNIGTVRNENFFAYRFNGIDLDGEDFVMFPMITGSPAAERPNVNVDPPGNPQVFLNNQFPSAVPGSTVLDRTTLNSWVYDGTVWDNFGFLGTGYVSNLPPGLTLDPETGWLYGYLPDTGISSNTYDFSLLIKKATDASLFSGPYDYNLTVIGPLDSEIDWLTPADPVERARTPSSLGTIDNGAVSTLYVEAINIGNTDPLPLEYELYLGTEARPQYNSLPQGLELLPSGDIAGTVSFNTFALDGGTTTFDVTKQNGEDPTTFDMLHVFTVRAYSTNGVIDVLKTFSITVNRRYNEPYESLYIQCMPPQDDRDLVDSLLLNSDIFPQDLLYRPTDPNFGVARKVIYNHAFGLTASTVDDYYASLVENHYWKNLILGEIKTAQATDDQGNVLYEVVYSQIQDDLVNDQGESVAKQVFLPYPINPGDSSEINSVYPNSLINMRDQVIDTVGQVSNILPRWMISKQENGRVLGFVPAWVIAYTKPGQSKRIAYYIQTKFDRPLNLVDFEVDRYELNRLQTKHWDPVFDSTGGSWVPHPPEYTTFDASGTTGTWINNALQVVSWINNDSAVIEWVVGGAIGQSTTFDQNSLQFTAPVDMYSVTQAYDKYLVFRKRNILE